MPALAAPVRPWAAPDGTADSPGGRPTLDELLGSAWEELGAGDTTACVVCGGAMDPQPDGGRCRDCGSALS
ncbi:MAG: hypothetical protein ABR581_09890 [Thermoleophilaceae bacterium]